MVFILSLVFRSSRFFLEFGVYGVKFFLIVVIGDRVVFFFFI